MTMNIHEESSLRSGGNSSRLANEPGKTKGGMWSGSIMPFVSPTLFVSPPNPWSMAGAEPGEGGLGSRFGL